MRIKVLVEKKPFKQSSFLPNTSGDGTPAKRSSSCGGTRDMKMKETFEVKVQKSSVYFMHLNKPQQVTLTTVWTFAISLTILVYNRY